MSHLKTAIFITFLIFNNHQSPVLYMLAGNSCLVIFLTSKITRYEQKYLLDLNLYFSFNARH